VLRLIESGVPIERKLRTASEHPARRVRTGPPAGFLACGSRLSAAFPECRHRATPFQWLDRRSASHVQLRGQLRSRRGFIPHRPHSRLTLFVEGPSDQTPVCRPRNRLSNGFLIAEAVPPLHWRFQTALYRIGATVPSGDQSGTRCRVFPKSAAAPSGPGDRPSARSSKDRLRGVAVPG
jgi:hypothetical protein